MEWSEFVSWRLNLGFSVTESRVADLLEKLEVRNSLGTPVQLTQRLCKTYAFRVLDNVIDAGDRNATS